MQIPRQTERRARFFAALNDMPRLETWDLPPSTTSVTIDAATGRAVKRQDFRLIPRRVRRDMARKLSQRRYRADHNLPEPG